MGWNFLPTSRNAKGIDLVAYSADGGKTLLFQTKGYTEIVVVGHIKEKSDIIADFYILASYVYQTPRIYILKREESKELLTPRKDKY